MKRFNFNKEEVELLKKYKFHTSENQSHCIRSTFKEDDFLEIEKYVKDDGTYKFEKRESGQVRDVDGDWGLGTTGLKWYDTIESLLDSLPIYYKKRN